MDRNYSIDYIKFFAIVSIVCIHTSPFSGIDIYGINGTIINDFIINVLARFGVPFFFITSGYLFAKKIIKTEEKSKYFKKYITKIIKIFICWYIFYALYGLALHSMQAIMDGVSFKLAISDYLKEFLLIDILLYGSGGFASYHLWYLLALVWSIMIVYICNKYNKIKEILIVSLILNLLGLFGQTYSGIFLLDIQTRDTVFFGLFYTSLGFYFGSNENRILEKTNKINSFKFLLLFSIFSMMQILERTIAEVFWANEIKSVDYYFFTIFSTASLFLFVMKNSQLGKKSKLTKVGSNAVGIYVSHTLFIGTSFLAFKIFDINIKSNLLFHLIFTPSVILISYFYYRFIQKIKFKLFPSSENT